MTQTIEVYQYDNTQHDYILKPFEYHQIATVEKLLEYDGHDIVDSVAYEGDLCSRYYTGGWVDVLDYDPEEKYYLAPRNVARRVALSEQVYVKLKSIAELEEELLSVQGRIALVASILKTEPAPGAGVIDCDKVQMLKAVGYKVNSTKYGYSPVKPRGGAIIRGWAKSESAAWWCCWDHYGRHKTD